MEKKIILSGILAISLFATAANAAGQNTNQNIEVQELTKQLKKQQKYLKSVTKQVKKLKKKLAKIEKRQKASRKIYFKQTAPMLRNNHLFWSLYMRNSYDFVDYKTKSGKIYANNILSNRVDFQGVYRVDEGLKATVVVEANNIYGMNSITATAPYTNDNWIANETPDDTTLRLREAYFNWYPADGVMISFGRRPATNGFPANLDNGDRPGSPLAQMVNMEFDGFSMRIGKNLLSKLYSDADKWNSWLKICAGRGYSDATGKWDTSGLPPYASDGQGKTDLLGVIFVPYSGNRYEIHTSVMKAWNIKGYNTEADLQANTLSNLGSMNEAVVMLKVKGLGDKNEILKNSIAFVSLGLSQTDPDSGKEMLGSEDSETGQALWVGIDLPAMKNDRWGVQYSTGSKYWKNFSYGEDRVTGSFSSVRGNAYEAYYRKQLRKALYLDTRVSLMKYNHAGSDGFFGITGSPDQADYVERAFNIRVDIKYNF